MGCFQHRGEENMSNRNRYQEIWKKRKAIYEIAVKALTDSLTKEQILELQTTMDEDPNDGVVDVKGR